MRLRSSQSCFSPFLQVVSSDEGGELW
uniref:Uncharacterized protein n=1 Tax=Solanum lycopersicum TaxID=4081 RepID=K4C369_SOLLC